MSICFANYGLHYPGWGKTLSYGIPLVKYLKTTTIVKKIPLRRKVAEPVALILAPTHELAIEIHETMLGLCQSEKIRCVLVYGGPPSKCQLEKLSEGCDVLIATPGRLLSFLRRGVIYPKNNASARQTPYEALSLANLQLMLYDESDEL